MKITTNSERAWKKIEKRLSPKHISSKPKKQKEIKGWAVIHKKWIGDEIFPAHKDDGYGSYGLAIYTTESWACHERNWWQDDFLNRKLKWRKDKKYIEVVPCLITLL